MTDRNGSVKRDYLERFRVDGGGGVTRAIDADLLLEKLLARDE